jgi:hypothetical protein
MKKNAVDTCNYIIAQVQTTEARNLEFTDLQVDILSNTG